MQRPRPLPSLNERLRRVLEAALDRRKEERLELVRQCRETLSHGDFRRLFETDTTWGDFGERKQHYDEQLHVIATTHFVPAGTRNDDDLTLLVTPIYRILLSLTAILLKVPVICVTVWSQMKNGTGERFRGLRCARPDSSTSTTGGHRGWEVPLAAGRGLQCLARDLSRLRTGRVACAGGRTLLLQRGPDAGQLRVGRLLDRERQCLGPLYQPRESEQPSVLGTESHGRAGLGQRLG